MSLTSSILSAAPYMTQDTSRLVAFLAAPYAIGFSLSLSVCSHSNALLPDQR